jgi:hypothetical protein
VVGRRKEWSVTYVAEVVEVVEDGSVNFHEHGLVLDTTGEASFLGLRAGFDDNKGLALDVFLLRGFNSEG